MQSVRYISLTDIVIYVRGVPHHIHMRSLPMHIARGIGFWFFHLYSKPHSLLGIESFGEVWEGERP